LLIYVSNVGFLSKLTKTRVEEDIHFFLERKNKRFMYSMFEPEINGLIR
jgi:hypothetical protein